eukprot:NODE_7947_length_732_cov_68.868637_g7695_i0.p1 GENE.NODE_7947_length_732_cov_68.868637_g7695_i0~~NODE_7947_length_732_cov_68.868637_g7695_i0.p1  ORF type:complete len:179 (+),score=44.69 NODE_7947_length_732_cov_68.868637_g7695_i0:80-616(+)
MALVPYQPTSNAVVPYATPYSGYAPGYAPSYAPAPFPGHMVDPRDIRRHRMAEAQQVPSPGSVYPAAVSRVTGANTIARVENTHNYYNPTGIHHPTAKTYNMKVGSSVLRGSQGKFPFPAPGAPKVRGLYPTAEFEPVHIQDTVHVQPMMETVTYQQPMYTQPAYSMPYAPTMAAPYF